MKQRITTNQSEEIRDHFTFFRSFREQIDLCDEADRPRLYEAITSYALYHIDTSFENPLAKMAWLGIRPHLEKSWVKWSNGCNGGAPFGNDNALKQPKNNQKTTKKQPIGKDRIGKDRIGKDDFKKEKNKKRNNLPGYITDDFADVMIEWIEYKKERGQSYKPRGLKICYNRLRELSGNDPAQARLIVENSIANNYQGLFRLKEDNNYESNRTTAAENILAAQQQHIRIVSASIPQAAGREGEIHGFLPDH